MATAQQIAGGIQGRIGLIKMSSWRIGLTHDLNERYKYWKDTQKEYVGAWVYWQANSLADAQAVEAHFIRQGMKGGTGGDLSAYRPVYVYIF